MKDQLNRLIPCQLNHLFNTNDYVVHNNIQPEIKITNDEQAKSIVSFCSRFVEAVVILDSYWFLSTSFFIFIHNTNIDDCADNLLVGPQKQAQVYTVGYDYFELTTRFNYVELLSTSGFFGESSPNTITAFVSSSVRDLPSLLTNRYDTVSSKYIFIPATTATSTKVERLLNQYMKNHAANKWMLLSTRFKEEGFAPYHPLSFTKAAM
ncbi:hypothetical protein INT47_001718 [Mucor saturninus]|uniref:Uncharacterized protein n=1 Tax=Mucor saturninus TaxID=64648 RepID=A0A8H7RJV7_9FUNG|nr:hypothetical protein INT47_001718 [Mucor saturninus]